MARRYLAKSTSHSGFLVLSTLQNRQQAKPRGPPTANLSLVAPPPQPSPLCSRSNQRRPRDQISIAEARGPRFSATKVSATPPTVNACPWLQPWRRRNLTIPRMGGESLLVRFPHHCHGVG